MDVTIGTTASRLRRLLLVALLAGIAWCALSLVASSGSASAADDDTAASGLLGTVGSVVNGVGGAVSDTTDVVDETLTSTVEVVAPVAEAVPVAAPVSSTVREVATSANTVVQQTDTVVRDTVDGSTGAVSDVAQAGLVSAVVDPVVDVVTDLPVAGGLVEQTGLTGVVESVADGLDTTVSTVVGTAPPTGSILPELPISALDPLSPPAVVDETGDPSTHVPPIDFAVPELPAPAPGATVPVVAPFDAIPAISGPAATSVWVSYSAALSDTVEAGSAKSVDETASAEDSHRWPGGGSTGLVAGGVASASGGSAGAGSASTSPDAARSGGFAFTSFRVHTDDALPGAPVFDTDVAPD